MHFRQLIKGLLIGTVLFFPAHALAAKTDPVQKGNAARVALDAPKQKSADRQTGTHPNTSLIAKPYAEKSTTIGTHSQSGKTQVSQRFKQLPEQASVTAKNARHDAVSNGKQKNVTAKTVQRSAHNSKQENRAAKELKQTAADRGKQANLSSPAKQKATEHGNGKASTKQNKASQPTAQTKNAVEPLDKTKFRSVSDVNKPIQMPNRLRMLNKTPALVKPISNKERKDQGPLNSFPDPLQVINLQSNTTLGQTSKDREKLGKGTNNFPAMWFNWRINHVLDVNRPYISRSDNICNQWTNAPPFQPPKQSLFS